MNKIHKDIKKLKSEVKHKADLHGHEHAAKRLADILNISERAAIKAISLTYGG